MTRPSLSFPKSPAPTFLCPTLALLILLCLLPMTAWSQSVPTTLSYQGRLLQNTTDQDAVAGSVNIVFSLWSGPAADGAAIELWTESWGGVGLSNGIFSVLLGSNGSPLDPAAFQNNTSLYLQLEVDGEVLLPRQQLGSTPFAMTDEPENELQDLALNGNQLELSDSTATVDLAGYLDNTDDQELSLSGNDLQLSSDNGTDTVSLAAYLDNTDDQELSLSGNDLQLSSDDGIDTVDLVGYLDNTDNQALSSSGTDLQLSSDDGMDTVSLAAYLDNTDNQTLTSSGTDLQLSSDDGTDTVSLAAYLDNTDNQTLSLDGETLNLSGSGSTVSLAAFLDNDDVTDLLKTLVGATARTVFVSSTSLAGSFGGLETADGVCQALANAGGLSGTYLAWLSDGIQSPSSRFLQGEVPFQRVDGSQIASNWSDLVDSLLSASISVNEQGAAVSAEVWTGTASDGTSAADHCSGWTSTAANATVGLTDGTDGTWSADGSAQACSGSRRIYCVEQAIAVNSDNQQLSLSGTDLRLTSDAGLITVSLASFLDDTDTDNQQLSLSGDNLQLTSDDGTDSVDLSKYLDNTDTDNQRLSLSGNNLRLTSDDGTDSVSLSKYLDDTDTDNQQLSLSGNNLRLTSDDGNDTVDLSGYLDNTDDQTLAEILAIDNGQAGFGIIQGLGVLSTNYISTSTFNCTGCVDGENVEDDSLGGDDLTNDIYLLHIDCEGECTDMNVREACDVVEDKLNLSVETEFLSLSCTHNISSSSGTGFSACNDGRSDNDCRAFRLTNYNQLPCADSSGHDVTVLCMATNIAK